ncbi:MAG: PD-(D/E)XK nuclease family protein [Halobacteriaceae archaeon]
MKRHDPRTLGTFKTGSLIHSFLEGLEEQIDAKFELSVSGSVGEPDTKEYIEFTGRVDCFDYRNDTIYDFKTRSDYSNKEQEFIFLDPPVGRHINQLHVYMYCLGIHEAQVVYISKSNLSVETYPNDRALEFDPDRFGRLVDKAREIKYHVEQEGIPRDERDVPFEKCGCFVCDQEQLDF